ncbi:MAG TPA: molybdopterin-binding protein [Planctomycetota bacterium]|jgi:molybdenum cofactor synthesis domain-containing protein|nr:molybdopterin-binding protein [Planctomycetota bacterium]
MSDSGPAGGRAAILSIGREILRGRTLDTNSHFLAGRLTSLGAEVVRIATADDDPASIAREFDSARALSPRIVVSTGGLGPTFDDLTLEGLARAFALPLRIDPAALEWVRESYRDLAARGLATSPDLTPEREKMARLPLGARPIRNPAGTAPAVALEAGSTAVLCLPGVPDEMRAVWVQEVAGEVARLLPGGAGPGAEDVPLATRDESGLAPVLRRLMQEFPGVYAKSRVSGSGETVQIVVTLTSPSGMAGRLGDVARRLREMAGAAGL